ncbi:MAG: restriction endonuclease subunit S [Bacteroidia bacterium]|nr:restriction endonuclease subunit S [Bacteroidia bacterium]
MKFEKLTELIDERITGEWGQEADFSGVSVIRTTNFTNEGKLDLSNVVKRNIEKKKIEKKSLKKGDIIIEKSGGGPTQPVGRVVYFDVESDGIFLCNNFTTILRPKLNLVNSKYLLYQMLYLHKSGRSKRYQNKTTGIHNLNLEKYLQEKIALPPLPEQLHIANILSKAENLIAQRKESIHLLDEFLKSTFLEMFGDPEKNPKNLPFTELEKLCAIIVDCPHSTPVKSKEATNYPCIRTSELTKGYISWDSMQYLDEEEYIKRIQRLIPEAGDIVYGREGTYGEAIRIPKTHKFSLGQRTMLFRPDYTRTNSIFLWAMVRSEFVYRQAKKKNSGSTVGHVNVKDIKQFRVYYPPIELQNQFAQIVEKTEALKSQYQQSLQELENLYGSLSQKAFRGELRVNA